MKRASATVSLSLALLGLGGYAATHSYLHGKPTDTLAAPKELTTYRDVVKNVLPAIVSIEASSKTSLTRTRMPEIPFDDFPGMPKEFRKRFEEFRKQPTPAPTPGRAFGSGFVVDPKGLVLTNDHVVRGAEQVVVQLNDGRKFTSRDIKHDPQTDLALVRIETTESLPYLEMGNSDTMEIGDRVLALGAPLGLKGSVTSGIVSAKGRDIHMNQYEDFVQTDAAINPGNSGGPLVNLEGKVIGINSAIKSGTGGFQGIGLAISSNLAKNVMQQLLKDGTVQRGYLGVQVQSLEPEVAERLGVQNNAGVVLAKVMPNAPAAKAGLKSGDILTTVAGKPVKSARDLQWAIAALPLNKPVEVIVLRDGASKSVQVSIESQPRNFGMAADQEPAPSRENSDATRLEKLGIEIANLSPDKASQFGFDGDTRGVVVTAVEPNGVAGRSGLRPGVLIVKIDRHEVKTAVDAQAALGKGSLEKGVLLQIQDSTGAVGYVVVKTSPSK